MSLQPIGLGVAAGLIIGIGLAALPSRPGLPPPRARLLSDCDGALAELCIHYRSDFHAQCVELYADFISALAPGTIIHVVTREAREFERFEAALREAGALRGVQLRPLITGFEITPWAKDRFGSLRRDDGVAVLAVPPALTPMEGPRGNDGHVPLLLAGGLAGVELQPLPFFFDGGDLLADADKVYVAATFLARNQPENIDNPAALLRRIGTTLDRRVISLGHLPGEVPDHHIGMYLTPLGDHTVAVADPDLGRTLLDGHPDAVTSACPDIERDDQAYAPFRFVIATLEAQGLTVVRVPLLLTTTARVYVTYNNAILEQRAGEKRIYMPVYDLPILDQAATRIFEAQGWRVIPIRVNKVYQHTGSLRCLVGVVRRS